MLSIFCHGYCLPWSFLADAADDGDDDDHDDDDDEDMIVLTPTAVVSKQLFFISYVRYFRAVASFLNCHHHSLDVSFGAVCRVLFMLRLTPQLYVDSHCRTRWPRSTWRPGVSAPHNMVSASRVVCSAAELMFQGVGLEFRCHERLDGIDWHNVEERRSGIRILLS